VKISGVVITKNEEANIRRCIESMLQVVDEVVVLDSDSTDQTCAIAEQLGATVHEVNWLGYANTKNLAVELVQHRYILSLDADEWLDEEAIQVIKGITHKIPEVTAFEFKRKNYFGSRWIRFGGWYPDKKIRLFDKTCTEWQGDFVHETLVVKRGLTMPLDGHIIHATVLDKEAHKQTIDKYARLAARQALESGKTLSILWGIRSTITHFIKLYLVKLGFLDGRIGLGICLRSAKGRWLRHKYFKEISK
jgi:glycosyltransferase involved in cell wall biosynthesis